MPPIFYFLQVAGFKYIRLYDASQGDLLYCDGSEGAPGGGDGGNGGDGGGGAAVSSRLRAQRNFSPVNVEAPDLARFPRFAQAQYTEAILGPGDAMYIPARCWHHVRSITTSASLSFFF